MGQIDPKALAYEECWRWGWTELDSFTLAHPLLKFLS
jgi:hypothetical protein